MKQLDLSPFKNALDSLNSIIERYEREGDIDIRDGMIQRFEYTYSLAIKMLVKFINYQSNDIIHRASDPPSVGRFGRGELI